MSIRIELKRDISQKVSAPNINASVTDRLYVSRPSKVYPSYFDFACDISVFVAGILVYGLLYYLGIGTTKK